MACWTPDGHIEGAVSAGFNGVTQPIADPFTISVFFVNLTQAQGMGT